MPIYEYLCPDCNRIYSFMARSYQDTATRKPTCPKCGATNLRKRMSRFAVQHGATSEATGDASDDGGGKGLDDPRIEREMMRLMDQAENIDENDPRQLGRLMRRMSEITGEGLDPEMEEAVRRLENGDDPESIEEDLGDLLDDDDLDGGGGRGPSYDDGLYPY